MFASNELLIWAYLCASGLAYIPSCWHIIDTSMLQPRCKIGEISHTIVFAKLQLLLVCDSTEGFALRLLKSYLSNVAKLVMVNKYSTTPSVTDHFAGTLLNILESINISGSVGCPDDGLICEDDMNLT